MSYLWTVLAYLAAFLTLGALVVVHELGHFLVAKWRGIAVLEFAVGFGKKICSIKFGETTYSWRLIPLGGFVKMAGDDPYLVYGEGSATAAKAESDKDAESSEEADQQLAAAREELAKIPSDRWFLHKGYWSKVAVVFAGPLANILFAVLIAFFLLLFYGVPTAPEGPDAPAIIGELVQNSPAMQAGLQPRDQIVAVGGKAVGTWIEMAEAIIASGGEELQLEILRPKAESVVAPRSEPPSTNSEPGAEAAKQAQVLESGHEKLTINLGAKPGNPELAYLEGREAKKQRFQIGISPYTPSNKEPLGVGKAALYSVLYTWRVAYMTVRGVVGLISGQISAKHIGSPIMIMQEGSKHAEKGLEALLNFALLISISLAILNLLPVPILDGGHILFFTVEALRGKPLSLRLQAVASQCGFLLLMALMLLAVSNDVRRVFGL